MYSKLLQLPCFFLKFWIETIRFMLTHRVMTLGPCVQVWRQLRHFKVSIVKDDYKVMRLLFMYDLWNLFCCLTAAQHSFQRFSSSKLEAMVRNRYSISLCRIWWRFQITMSRMLWWQEKSISPIYSIDKHVLLLGSVHWNTKKKWWSLSPQDAATTGCSGDWAASLRVLMSQ